MSTIRPEVVERAIAAGGGVSELARKMNMTRQAISQWGQIPATRAVEVEEITGIPRHELRPDVFPAPEAAA